MFCASAWKKCAPKSAAPESGFEDFCERHRDVRAFGAQDAVQHFVHLARRLAKRLLSQRVDDPNVANAHLEIIRQLLIKPRCCVFSA